MAEPGTVQATLLAFDEHTSTGRLILDDGSVRDFDASAFAASGLRLVRPGQRLNVREDGSGTIASISIV